MTAKRNADDVEFNARMRRILDATAMDNSTDAYHYALLGAEAYLPDEKARERAILIIGPALATLLRMAEYFAIEAGTDRQTICALIRDTLTDEI